MSLAPPLTSNPLPQGSPSAAGRRRVAVRIIARRLRFGHWEAFFERHPEVTCDGNTPTQAALRLANARPDLDSHSLQEAEGSQAEGRIVYEVAQRGRTCPDCGGSGRYVGLLKIEPCATCGGAGRLTR